MARRDPPAWLAGLLAHRRTLWIGGGVAGLAVVAAIVAWVVWPDRVERTPRALEYQDFDVCMLVDSGGIVPEPAAAAWAGLREITNEAKVRLSYLEVTGPQTQEQATLFVPTLVQQGCDVVVAVGANQARAVRAVESTYPAVRFLTVESDIDVAGVASQVATMLPSA